MSYGNLLVRKGGLPPLQRSVVNVSSFQAYIGWSLHTTAAVLIASDETLRLSGGKPPFLTCKLAGLEPSFWDRLVFIQSLSRGGTDTMGRSMSDGLRWMKRKENET